MSDISENIPEFTQLSPTMRRWIFFWNTVSYLSLLSVTILMLFNVKANWPPAIIPQPLGWPLKLVGLGGALLWGLWYYFFVICFTPWQNRTHWKTISFVAAVLLGFGLSCLHPVFFYLLFNLFGVVFGVLPLRHAIIVMLVLAPVMALRILLLSGVSWVNLGEISWIFIYTFGVILIGSWINAIMQQTKERMRMVDQLQYTRAELAKREREAGMLEERQRLAAAIHDTLAQDLTSIVMHLEAAEQSFSTNETTALTHLNTARAAAREGLAEARRFVWALQPEVSQHEPLPRAIERITRNWSQETGIPSEFTLEGSESPLSPPVEVTLLRAAQESLANVRKHASAHRVNLTMTYMQNEVILDVQDDGRGFDPALLSRPGAQSGGYGIFSLRERARELGGSFTIESEAGAGTTVVMQLPLYNTETESQ
ncbi:MAG: two-component sensor histidine kinase [Chloroflexi bacterium HGW-Chloroflexi-10]|nr:MAG: two-component sensor histidine kinase [Chloroflexi bacterium HGW-Chloroflexi-10]